MSQSKFLLYDDKKSKQRSISLRAERVSFYMQSEVIEAFSNKNETYYLFFYKNKFLAAFKTKKLRRNSFIEDVFKKGIIFQAPHPFINALLSTNHPCQIAHFDTTLRHLNKTYTPQEKAFILTFFESFIPKKQLFKEIQLAYYDYRRNGQNFLSYHIIEILQNFVPNHSWVNQLAGDLSFKNYMAKSNKNFGDLFVEKALYHKKDDEQYFVQLVTFLEKEERWIHLIALYLYKMVQTPSTAYYHSLLKLLEQHFSEDEKYYVLEHLSYQIPTYIPIKKELFDYYLKKNNLEVATQLMTTSNFKLTDVQIHQYNELLENWDPKINVEQPEAFQGLLKSVMKMYPENAEKLLHKFVSSLLTTHNLNEVVEWLHLFKKDHKNLEVFNKVEQMKKLNDDLDEMQTLGELYYEFHQLEKGIECFSLEMELKPADPKPLQWLSKVYREMGMTQESVAFQKLCSSLHRIG